MDLQVSLQVFCDFHRSFLLRLRVFYLFASSSGQNMTIYVISKMMGSTFVIEDMLVLNCASSEIFRLLEQFRNPLEEDSGTSTIDNPVVEGEAKVSYCGW